MSLFEVHTIESAPEQSRATLEQAKKSMGMVPNLYGVLSEAPAALEAYNAVNKAFSSASLSSAEQQVVLLTVAVENGCTYCVAAHSTLAHKQDVAGHVVEAIRNETAVDDAKLEALRQFTIDVVKKRGWVDSEHVQAFLNAGFEKKQILEVIVGVAQKTLSNYVNHIADTPVDDAFESHKWERKSS